MNRQIHRLEKIIYIKGAALYVVEAHAQHIARLQFMRALCIVWSHEQGCIMPSMHVCPQGKTPSLKRLAKEYLGKDIQKGEHTPVRSELASMVYCVMCHMNLWMQNGMHVNLTQYIRISRV